MLKVRRQTSALALDIVGGALFGADLAGNTEGMAKAVDAGQRVAVLAALLPLPGGPRTSRALKVLARRAWGTKEGVEGMVGR